MYSGPAATASQLMHDALAKHVQNIFSRRTLHTARPIKTGEEALAVRRISGTGLTAAGLVDVPLAVVSTLQ